MSADGNPDDATLLLTLDTSQADAWRALAELAEDFRIRPHADDDCVWPERATGQTPYPEGRVARGISPPGHPTYPEYGSRVLNAWELLDEVGAVTPAYHWMEHRPPALDPEGKVSVADAVRLATTIIRSERFGDGNIGAAVEQGTLQRDRRVVYPFADPDVDDLRVVIIITRLA